MNNLKKETLPVIFSNLQKASDKQQQYEDAEMFGKLSERYAAAPAEKASFEELEKMLSENLKESYPRLQKDAEALNDRGAQRALRWGQKVTAIQKSVISRYLKKGESLLEDQYLFVCEACGFIFLGDAAPDICPVCKAPSSRFSKV